MIADSPSHGKNYHDGESDDYPEDDMTEELKKLAREKTIFIGTI